MAKKLTRKPKAKARANKRTRMAPAKGAKKPKTAPAPAGMGEGGAAVAATTQAAIGLAGANFSEIEKQTSDETLPSPESSPTEPKKPIEFSLGELELVGKFFLQCLGVLKPSEDDEAWDRIIEGRLGYSLIRILREKIQFGMRFGSQEAVLEGIKRGELFNTYGYPFSLIHATLERLTHQAHQPDESPTEKFCKRQATSRRELASIIAHLITSREKDVLRPWLFEVAQSREFTDRWEEIFSPVRRNNRHNLQWVFRRMVEFESKANVFLKLLDETINGAERYIADVRKEHAALAESLELVEQRILWRDNREKKRAGVFWEYFELRRSVHPYAKLVMPFINEEWKRYVSVKVNADEALKAKWGQSKKVGQPSDKRTDAGRFPLLSCVETVVKAFPCPPIPADHEESFLWRHTE